MENQNQTILSTGQGGECPFKKLNKRFQKNTKHSISELLAKKQTEKHKMYVDILKRSFEENKLYFTRIQDFITDVDIKEFESLQGNKASKIVFLNQKLKELFWKGFIFDDHNNLTNGETIFVKIGNLGLDDVTMIVNEILPQDMRCDESVFTSIEEEIDIRLRNNVLIDAVIHLDDFPDRSITKDKQSTSTLIGTMIEENAIVGESRFSTALIPEEFKDPMTRDGMIDEKGVIPQLTFGCPIVNLNKGSVFKEFVTNFLRRFLMSDKV